MIFCSASGDFFIGVLVSRKLNVRPVRDFDAFAPAHTVLRAIDLGPERATERAQIPMCWFIVRLRLEKAFPSSGAAC